MDADTNIKRSAAVVTTIQVCNVDAAGDFSIEIMDNGEEASLWLTVQRADDGEVLFTVPYMLPDAARALAAVLLKTADAIGE